MNNIKDTIGYADYSFNPITGCLNHTNGLCKGGGFPCYANKIANANGGTKHLYLRNPNVAPAVPGWEYNAMDIGGTIHILDARYLDPFYPRFWPERLEEFDINEAEHYRRKQKAKRIFLCDMSDLFGIGIPENWQEQIFEVIKANWQHTFLLLTKQPQNLARWSPFPDNCEVGVTHTGIGTTLLDFCHILARLTFISFEPLLKSVINDLHLIKNLGIGWIIIGATTGSLKDLLELQKKYPELTLMKWDRKWTLQPQLSWVEEIETAANKANIPIFEKDNLSPLLDYNLRQELPCSKK